MNRRMPSCRACSLDSPGRNHTLIRLRGYQAGSRRHGILAHVPPLTELQVFSSPGLTGLPVTDAVTTRTRGLMGTLRRLLVVLESTAYLEMPLDPHWYDRIGSLV